jgi:hypothetical protein
VLLTILACALALLTTQVHAAETEVEDSSAGDWSVDEWHVQISLYTKHWDPEPDHDNSQSLFGVEAVFHNGWIAGGAVFDNSFGQTSQYVFMGRSWQMFHSKYWYFKLTAGLLHGYKEPYKDKIPLNDLGIAPAMVPIIGFRYKRVFVETNILGNAAVTITAGFAF